MITEARQLIAEGFGALPLKANKAPLLPEGHQYLYELIPEDQIDSLFMKAAKIGIACGQASDGFYCIDFDAHKGENIASIFNQYWQNEAARLIIETNKLPVFKTPSGGFHIYFRCEVKNQPGRHLSKWETGEVMIETRGHGQYVACFPSSGYKKLAGTDIIEVSRITTDERDTLFDIATGFNQFIKTDEPTAKGSGKWPEQWDTSKPIGRYNETEAEHAKEILTSIGWQLLKTRRDGVELWLRPGKAIEHNVTHSATFGSKHNMFYCFTSADSIFKEWTAYSPFDILMHGGHGGDFKKAVEFLENRYRSNVRIEPPQVEEEEIKPTELPHFPIEVFPKDVAQFITSLHDTLNYNIDFLSLAAMFTISVCNGNRHKLQVKNGWIAPTIFWFSIVGEPGTMKSHPVGLMINPLRDLDKDSKRLYDVDMEEWNRIDKERKPRKPRFKQILISDYTLEALHDIHDFNKRGIGLYKDELVGFLNDMNKYRKGSDEQFWLESFNNKSYVVNRVTKEPIFIEDININILGTIQPKVLNTIVREFQGNGLVDRFLYSRSESEIYPLPRLDIDPAWIKWWGDAIKNISNSYTYEGPDSTAIIHMTTEAMEFFYDCDLELIEMQRSENITANMKGYLNKIKTYLPRFALLMYIFDRSFGDLTSQVNHSHMERAWQICQYFIKSAMNLFNEVETTMEINEVAQALNGKTKKEKIAHLHAKGFKNNQISKVLTTSPVFVSRILKELNK